MSPCKEGFEIVQEVIKVKWVPEILLSLDSGNHQFNELLKSIPYLSHTELNRKLKFLAMRQLILKHETTKQGYTLQPFGYDLLHILKNFEVLHNTYKPSSSKSM